MRRTALLVLPALLALVPAAPSSAGGVCTSSSGVTACPTAVSRCNTNDTISVRVFGGSGYGAASCGGTTSDCYVVRFSCNEVKRTVGSGILTCTATGNVVAVCDVTIAAN